MRCRLATAVVAVGLAASCGPRQRTDIERIVVDSERGVRYVVPVGWKSFDGEFRSAAGSLLSIKVWDLADADRAFVAGLPDTLFPQLAEWAKYYYIVDGKPARSETTVAGLPATELTYPIRIRLKDPPSKVTYWVVRRGARLFVLRAAFAPSGLAVDEPALRRVVSAWQFVETPT